MKKLFTVENLVATHYDNGDHILEFADEGKKLFVTVRGLGPVDDEDYWDDEDRIVQAVLEAAPEDIEIRMPHMRSLRLATGMTQKEFSQFTGIPLRTIEGWDIGHRTPPEYVVKLVAYKIDKEDAKLASMISLDNGNTFLTAEDAMPIIQERDMWDVVANYMDDDIRETVHAELAPCTEMEFLHRYLQLAKDDLLIG